MRKLSVIFVLWLVLLLSACASNDAPIIETQPPTLPATPTEEPIVFEANAPLINMRVVPAYNQPEEEIFSSDELKDIYDGQIYSCSCADIFIQIDGVEMSFRDAVLGKHITIDDFLAGLHSDARNGYCVETYGSYLGLTHFIYTYENYQVVLYDDLWEAPNGESYLVREIRIGRFFYEFDPTRYARFYIDEEGFEVSYRREDWGLTFEVLEVTPTSVRVKVTQQGGQQFGQLQAALKSVPVFKNMEGYLNTNHGTRAYTEATPSDGFITMNGTTEFTFDWSKDLGELPSGLYSIDFMIYDIYDADQIHPFTKNYKDSEIYNFIFEIP